MFIPPKPKQSAQQATAKCTLTYLEVDVKIERVRQSNQSKLLSAASHFCRTTQILYCIVFVTRCLAWRSIDHRLVVAGLCSRYLDLLDHTQSFYLVFFKLT